MVEEGSLGFGPFATGDLGFVDDFGFFRRREFSGKFQVVNQLEESLGSGKLRVLLSLIGDVALGGGDEVTTEFEFVVVFDLLGVFF